MSQAPNSPALYIKIYLSTQILTALAAPFIFGLIEVRQVAALVAGWGFIFQGFLGLWCYGTWPHSRPWGAWNASLPQSASTLKGWKTLGLWVTGFHLFAVSLPMVVVRMLHWNEDFSAVHIYGIPGPVFHKMGAGASTALFVATLFDWWFLTRKKKRNLV